MKSQVIFLAKEDLKQAALKKAKGEGVTLKAILNACLVEYVEGRLSFGVKQYRPKEVSEVVVTEDLQKKMDIIGKMLE